MSITSTSDVIKGPVLVYQGRFRNSPFIVRLATHEDYDDVVKIDENVYGGADYLPSTYHVMIDEPTAHCFIAELDGKVIAFVCYWIDGLTNTMTTSTAGRVNIDYRHQGLYTHFTNLVELEMKKNYPLLQINLSLIKVSESLIKKFHLTNGRLVCQKTHIFANMSLEDIQRGKDLSNMNVNVYTPSSSQLTEIFNHRSISKYLFPTGVFIHADRYRPYPPTDYYIRQVIGKGPVILSGSLDSDDLGISTINLHRCPLGVRLTISYDGKPEVGIIQAHILKATSSMAKSCREMAIGHLNKSFEKEREKPLVRMGILFPCTVDQNLIWQFVRETFNCCDSNDIFASYGVFEKPYL